MTPLLADTYWFGLGVGLLTLISFVVGWLLGTLARRRP